MLNKLDLFLISNQPRCVDKVQTAVSTKPFSIQISNSLSTALGKIYESPPAVILIDEITLSEDELAQLHQFKNDNLFSHIPLLLLVSETWEKQEKDWRRYPVEDYLTTRFRPEELRNRIMLAINRLQRLMDANPLTRLPGNTSILRTIQEALDLKKDVVIAYVDLDNFKAFNDRYGFSRGDEALRLTGRLLSNVIGEFKDDFKFVGHIGGDDFIFILQRQHAEIACQKIIASFDAIAPCLYDDDDRLNGYICITDRSRRLRYVPLLSISISAIDSSAAFIGHYGEVSAIASEMKKHIKNLPGSNYLINRRKNNHPL